jgi:hypothetical protein
MRIWALLAFNGPILTICLCLRFVEQLNQALREKPRGNELGAASYSRITGLFGAVVTASLFWAIGNVVVWRVFEDPEAARKIIAAVLYLFLVGSALFLPYAFNQLRSMINPVEATVAKPEGPRDGQVKELAPGVMVASPGKVIAQQAPSDA